MWSAAGGAAAPWEPAGRFVAVVVVMMMMMMMIVIYLVTILIVTVGCGVVDIASG